MLRKPMHAYSRYLKFPISLCSVLVKQTIQSLIWWSLIWWSAGREVCTFHLRITFIMHMHSNTSMSVILRPDLLTFRHSPQHILLCRPVCMCTYIRSFRCLRCRPAYLHIFHSTYLFHYQYTCVFKYLSSVVFSVDFLTCRSSF